MSSAIRLVTPMMLVGFTALSVEIITKSFTSNCRATSATLYVPKMLLVTA